MAEHVLLCITLCVKNVNASSATHELLAAHGDTGRRVRVRVRGNTRVRVRGNTRVRVRVLDIAHVRVPVLSEKAWVRLSEAACACATVFGTPSM
eukprot:976662-Pleurochrysis_carterae.AAC.1